MAKAASLLPSTIEQATKGTPVAMLMQVVDRQNIEAFLAVELTKTASMVNVDERLNLQEHQIPIIARQLIDDYKSESLADFKICFERGAMGRYDDKLLRLDAAVINNWMAKYLEERYQVVENQLMNEKENPYQTITKPLSEGRPDWNLAALLDILSGKKEIPPEVIKHLEPWQLKEVEDARKTARVGDFESNDYFKVKIQHAREKRERQAVLNRESSEFYKDRQGVNLQQYEDDKGFYVLAENESDALTIYQKSVNDGNETR